MNARRGRSKFRFVSVPLRWALVVIVSLHVCVAQQRYSTSAEYQEMMREIHQDAPSPAFIATGTRPQADPHLRVKAHQDKQTLQLATASLKFSVSKNASSITVLNAKTQAQWTVACGSAPFHAEESKSTQNKSSHNQWTLSQEGGGACSTLTLEILNEGLARLTFHKNTAAAQLHVGGNIPLFGLGERFWQASLAGTSLEVRPADRSGEPGHAWVYVAVPFVVSPGGLGLYADTAFDSTFRFDEPGSSFDVKVAGSPVSFYIFSAADPKAVISDYTAITGRPQNPPLWTFGPWINALQGIDAVTDMAEKIRTLGIPASALWVFDEMDEPNNLGWPFWFSSYYGDPRGFTDSLHAKGFKVLNYVHPYVRERMLPYPTLSPAYLKGVQEKLLVTGEDGLPSGPGFEPVRTGDIDFTNPAAVDWWQQMITAAVRDQGFDGWMEDFGEWVADTDNFAAGKGTKLAELYPLLYHKITIRIAQQLNPNVAPFSRSGSSGSQQFSPVLWGADQQHNWSRDYGLPSVITAGITAGMSGYSTWGPDILSDGDSKELWLRWVEFAALTPVMRDHVWSKPQYSVNLWTDAETQGLFKRYAILHSALLPYLATYAAEAHRTGVPIMRHTVLEFPNDPRSYGAEYQYLLGEHLLVAPVIEPAASSRKLYLPQGEWLNYWTGDLYHGGQDVTVAAPIDQIPLLVRAGSVLPFKPESETHSFNWSDPQLLSGSLQWKIYLGTNDKQEGTFTLPDGTSAHMKTLSGVVSLDGTSTTAHVYQIVVRMRAAPVALRLEDKPLEAIQPPPTADGANGWWYDRSTHEVHAVIQAVNFHLEIAGAN